MKLRGVLAVGVLVVLAGCSIWPQARYDSGRSGYNPFETTISLASHSLVRNRFIGVVAPEEPVVGSDGFTYVADRGGDVGAYDIHACQPGRCRPVFSAPGSQPTLTHGMLLAAEAGHGGVVGYDPHGAQNCSGTPVVCAPVYSALTVQFGNPSTYVDGYVVAGDVLYELQEVNDEGERRVVVAYDLNGVQGCRHDPNYPNQVVCSEMWISGYGNLGDYVQVGRPASADGRVFIRENDDGGQALVALDRTGVRWSAPGDFIGNPVVAAGLVWVSRRTGEVDAFDASGNTGCSGTPKVCTPRWTAAPPSPASGYAVANGNLYVGTTDGHLYTFDAAGGASCDATSKVCAPLWSALDDPGYAINDPTIANGLVYAVSSNADVDLLDAAGNVGCGGTPKVCHRVFNDHGGTAPAGSGVVADGRLFVRTADQVMIYTPN